MTAMFFSPLSGEYWATFPHLLERRLDPYMPNPILESHVLQSFCSLLMMPILALELKPSELTTLNPSMLHSNCKDASEPDPVKWRGVARQRSVKIGSLPPVLRQWNWFVGRLSYRGRSLWRMCSSRSLAWFLVSRTQSALQQDCIPVDWSNT